MLSIRSQLPNHRSVIRSQKFRAQRFNVTIPRVDTALLRRVSLAKSSVSCLYDPQHFERHILSTSWTTVIYRFQRPCTVLYIHSRRGSFEGASQPTHVQFLCNSVYLHILFSFTFSINFESVAHFSHGIAPSTNNNVFLRKINVINRIYFYNKNVFCYKSPTNHNVSSSHTITI